MNKTQQSEASVSTDGLDDWSTFPWPVWVPLDVRKQIEEFWMSDWGRSPKNWQQCIAERGHPPLGTRVRCKDIFGSSWFEGRWVPAHNNMGCIIFDDGSYKVGSLCNIEVI